MEDSVESSAGRQAEKCHRCLEPVPAGADRCPHCGDPLRKGVNVRMLLIALVGTILFIAAAFAAIRLIQPSESTASRPDSDRPLLGQ